MLPVLIGLGIVSLVGTGISLYCDSQAAKERKRQVAIRLAAAARRAELERARREAQEKAEALVRRKRLVELGEARAKLAQATTLVAKLSAVLGEPGLGRERRKTLAAQLAVALAAQDQWAGRAAEVWAEVVG